VAFCVSLTLKGYILILQLKKRIPRFDIKQTKYTRFVDLCKAMADKVRPPWQNFKTRLTLPVKDQMKGDLVTGPAPFCMLHSQLPFFPIHVYLQHESR
jgi:hypothetical protein